MSETRDIVERLNAAQDSVYWLPEHKLARDPALEAAVNVMSEAAEEIERLRSEIKELRLQLSTPTEPICAKCGVPQSWCNAMESARVRAAKEERDACAKLAEEYSPLRDSYSWGIGRNIAAIIRARNARQ